MNCVIAGAGAIGKAVAGYCFKSIGADVTFIDADINTIDDINKRKSYVIYSTEFNKDSFSETVCDVKAVSVFDVASDKVLSDADVVCTAMGEKGLEAFLPKFINNLKIRIDSGNTSRLILLLCENIEDCLNKVIKKIESEIIIPDFLIVKAACIERMSGVIKENDSELNVLCEQHFPIIIEKQRLEDTAFAMNPKYFMLTDNIDLYYKRKLYLGNLGHAVLGYFGLQKGKKTVLEAMYDSEIRSLTEQALNESAEGLSFVYPDNRKEIFNYAQSRIYRFLNPNLDDQLVRVVRSPIRKLGLHERMCAPAIDALKAGVIPEAILKTMLYAMDYYDENDTQCVRLKEIYKNGGAEAVLKYSAGLERDSDIVNEIKKINF